MRAFNVLVTTHISHLNAEQTIRSSNLATLLDDAITTVIPDGSEDDFQHVGPRAMMAVRIKGGSGQADDDHSDDERPCMVLSNQEAFAEGVIPISLSAEEDASVYEPAPTYNPDDDDEHAFSACTTSPHPTCRVPAARVVLPQLLPKEYNLEYPEGGPKGSTWHEPVFVGEDVHRRARARARA